MEDSDKKPIFAPLFLKDVYCMPDIKKKIRECGFTAQQIAEKLNISQQAVSQAINGNPSLSRLEQIAGAIGISVSELLQDEAPNTIKGNIDADELHITISKDIKKIIIDREQ